MSGTAPLYKYCDFCGAELETIAHAKETYDPHTGEKRVSVWYSQVCSKKLTFRWPFLWTFGFESTFSHYDTRPV